MAKKYVYLFGGRATKAEGNADMKAVLGGKGANLAEMTNLGIPVPPGFTISTDMCTVYYETKGLPKDLKTQVKDAIKKDIHKFSMIPDLTAEIFAVNSSGGAMKYKLLGL
jgi:pyruvate,orthophosphate dikinase